MSSANINLRIARDLSSSGWEKFKDYRDKKSQEAVYGNTIKRY